MKVVFCYNQVSYIIARNLCNICNERVCIIFSKNRINEQAKLGNRLTVLPYHYLIAIFILILSCITSIEVVFPHDNAGRIIKLIVRYCRKLSFIDDGMDSFRSKPRNINLSLIRSHSIYYTFNYNIRLANWVKELKIVPVCKIDKLIEDKKPSFDIKNEFGAIIIESTGVKHSAINIPNSLYFAHPNYNKKNNHFNKSYVVSGGDYSIEKTLNSFDGDVIVGETMVLIFLLCLHKHGQLCVMLTSSQFDNLFSIQSELYACKSLILMD